MSFGRGSELVGSLDDVMRKTADPQADDPAVFVVKNPSSGRRRLLPEGAKISSGILGPAGMSRPDSRMNYRSKK